MSFLAPLTLVTLVACQGSTSASDDAGLERDANANASLSEAGIADGAVDANVSRLDAGTEAADAGPIGCGARPPRSGTVAAQNVTAAGRPRSYTVSIPSAYDGKKSYPFVFAFHGSGQDGFGAQRDFAFERDHEAEAFFVYPNGTSAWDIDDWDDAQNIDVAFFDAVLADLRRRYCVDDARIFVTGLSRGGFFANHLACHRGGVIRAVASHAAGGPLDPSGTHVNGQGNLACPGVPIPALVVIGDADSLAPDADFTRGHYHAANGCSNAAPSPLAPLAPSPCVADDGCAQKVGYCRVPSLGHALWERGAEATWSFFMTP